MSREREHLPARLWALLAALSLAWGFNWTALKLALSEIPPWTFRSICLGLGSLVLFTVLRLGGQPFVWPRGRFRRLWLLAVLNISAWNVLIAFGVKMIPSGRAAILAYTMPAIAIPLSVWLLGERLAAGKLVGLALGMGGMALLMGEGLAGLGASPLGSVLVLGAATSWALGAVLQKKYPVAMPTGSYTAWIMLLGAVPIVAGALLFEDTAWLRTVGPAAIAGTAYNVFIAFAFAHWAWIRLATSMSVSSFSLSMLVIPVVGVFSGVVFLGERPSWTEYLALLLVLGSLASVLASTRAARG
ncbi:MAG TPA: DMT family transporter [Burkholderiales bacterium]|nr:DMT family transporter [Burkholderiales bacterium]